MTGCGTPSSHKRSPIARPKSYVPSRQRAIGRKWNVTGLEQFTVVHSAAPHSSRGWRENEIACGPRRGPQARRVSRETGGVPVKWITIVLVVVLCLAAAGALAALVGSRLPRTHVASREGTFPVPPEAVWSTITNIDAFPSWRGDVKRIQRLPDRDGRPVWIEETRSGKMTLATDRMEAPRMLVLRIADPDLPFGGTWTYEITPAPAGSRLTITENGEIYNPLFRFMARFVFGYEGTIASYMTALEKRLATPGSRAS